MAKQTSVFSTRGFRTGLQTITGGDTTTKKDLIAAGSDDSIVRSITITSQDTAQALVRLYLNDGTSDSLLTIFTVPPNSGNAAGVLPIDGLGLATLPVDARGNKVFLLAAGSKLRVAAASTVGADLNLTALAEDY